MLKKLSIKKKMIYWNVVVIIFFAATLIYLSNDSLNMLMTEKKTQIKNLTDSAAGVINTYVELEKQGKINKEDAIKAVKVALNASRYDEDNYFFVGDYDLRQIVNPKRPKDDGVVQTTPQYYKFREISQKSKDGDFTSYSTTKPGATGEFPKLSYVKPIPAWKWFVGTGIYIDDINQQKNRYIVILVIICSIITLLLMSVGTLLANFISIPLSKTSKSLLLASNEMEKNQNT